jgi:DNA-binding transcriptional ArsR family regulator
VPFWKLLGAIGNGAGIRYELLFHLLARPRDVGWLARALDLDQPRVSQHLAELRKAGVVAATYENGHRVYAITGNASIIAGSAQRRPSIAVIGSDGVGMVFIDLRGKPGGARIESLVDALTELATEQAAARSLGSSPPRAGAGRGPKAVEGASARSAAARPEVPAAERGGRANQVHGAPGKGGEEVEVTVRAGLKGQAGRKAPPGA